MQRFSPPGLVLGLVLASTALADPPTPPAPDVPVMQRQLDELRAALDALRARIATLEGQLAAAQSAAVAAPAAPPPLAIPSPAPAAPAQTANYFNPSISVIGNFLGVAGHDPVANLPAAELRESEVGLQAVVDPYARGDFFISFGEEGVGVEEGYATFTALPAKFLVKVGRMRVPFGRTNTLHLHVLPWPDEPLPIVNLLGGEEGWIGTGASVSRIFGLPHDLFSEATLDVLRGSSDGLFEPERRGDLAYDLHWRFFKDLTEATNLDLGLSYGLGPNASRPGAKTRLEALDMTLRWKPLRTATYRALTVQGEAFRSLREGPGATQDAFGWFLSEDYRFAKRWLTGVRLEASERADDASRLDTGKAVTLTFWPSEFSQLRGELRRRSYATGDVADEVLIQMQFAIGAHGAHPF